MNRLAIAGLSLAMMAARNVSTSCWICARAAEIVLFGVCIGVSQPGHCCQSYYCNRQTGDMAAIVTLCTDLFMR